jgi:endo-1,4-beta-xylanase
LFKIVGLNGLVVDIPGGQSADGLQVQQYHDHNGANQQWLVVPINGDFKIVCPATGLVLQVPPDGPQANAPLQQGLDVDGGNQAWRLIPSLFGGIPDYLKIASALNTNFVLDVPDGRTDDGVRLQVFPDNGGGNQKWQFVNIPSG